MAIDLGSQTWHVESSGGGRLRRASSTGAFVAVAELHIVCHLTAVKSIHHDSS
jgi:hypothetical protein